MEEELRLKWYIQRKMLYLKQPIVSHYFRSSKLEEEHCWYLILNVYLIFPEPLSSGIPTMASDYELKTLVEEEMDPKNCFLQKFRLYETQSVKFLIVMLSF